MNVCKVDVVHMLYEDQPQNIITFFMQKNVGENRKLQPTVRTTRHYNEANQHLSSAIRSQRRQEEKPILKRSTLTFYRLVWA